MRKQSNKAAKPAPVAPATSAPVDTAASIDRFISRYAAHAARGVARLGAHFGNGTSRDDCYLAAFHAVTSRSTTGTFTESDLIRFSLDCGLQPVGNRAVRNPFGDASTFPSLGAADTGALTRAIKRGVIVAERATDGRSTVYTLTSDKPVMQPDGMPRLDTDGNPVMQPGGATLAKAAFARLAGNISTSN